MRVVLNGQPRELPEGAGLIDAIAATGAQGQGRGLAVAIDGLVVARRDWPSLVLSEGQRIEVLTAVQGG
ncbi:MAG: sulfur carrier protein ThiS [Thermoleophilaceae bacterium]